MLAVDALTALECICHGLEPHTIDIANHFIDHGVTFSTFSYLPPSTQIPKCGPQQCRLLGRHPKGYTFNLADYAAYITLRDSYLCLNPHSQAALCMGGIVACLAQEGMSAMARQWQGLG